MAQMAASDTSLDTLEASWCVLTSAPYEDFDAVQAHPFCSATYVHCQRSLACLTGLLGNLLDKKQFTYMATQDFEEVLQMASVLVERGADAGSAHCLRGLARAIKQVYVNPHQDSSGLCLALLQAVLAQGAYHEVDLLGAFWLPLVSAAADPTSAAAVRCRAFAFEDWLWLLSQSKEAVPHVTLEAKDGTTLFHAPLPVEVLAPFARRPDVHADKLLHRLDDARCTPLLRACWRNSTKSCLQYTVPQLFMDTDSRIDVNVKDAEGRTPLLGAAANYSRSVVKQLLQLKADPHAVDSQGHNALQYSILHTYHPFGYLLEACTWDAKELVGALDLIVRLNRVAAARTVIKLLEAEEKRVGSAIDVWSSQEPGSLNLLHKAAQHADGFMVLALYRNNKQCSRWLHSGARFAFSVSVSDTPQVIEWESMSPSTTPLAIATLSSSVHSVQAMEQLLALGALFPSTVFVDGEELPLATVLVRHVAKLCCDKLRLLLANGCSVNTVDPTTGRTLLHDAVICRSSQLDVVQCILSFFPTNVHCLDHALHDPIYYAPRVPNQLRRMILTYTQKLSLLEFLLAASRQRHMADEVSQGVHTERKSGDTPAQQSVPLPLASFLGNVLFDPNVLDVVADFVCTERPQKAEFAHAMNFMFDDDSGSD